MKPDTGRSRDDSQPFLLRIWKEEAEGRETGGDVDDGEEGAIAWRGKLLHIVKGDAHLFSGWPALIALLEASFQSEGSGEAQHDDSDQAAK
jgi:hypothetical protein